MGTLIDTSVLIHWEREEGPPPLDPDSEVALSAITASELLHGVHRANTAQRRHRRERWVESLLSVLPILPVDLEVSRVHARVWADLAASGQLIGAHDLLIAATALAHDLDLATRNEAEFGRIDGLTVVRW